MNHQKKENSDKIDKIKEKCTNNIYLDPLAHGLNKIRLRKIKNLSKITQKSNILGKSSVVMLTDNQIQMAKSDLQQQIINKKSGLEQNGINVSNTDNELPSDISIDIDEEEMEKDISYDSTTDSMHRIDAVCDKIQLLQSIYEGRPNTVFFPYPPQCNRTRDTSRCVQITKYEESKFDLKFKFTQVPFKCILNALEFAGFQETEQNDFNIYWGMNSKKVKYMNKYQKINHFPGCWNLGRKDFLWKNLVKCKRKYPKDFNFIPNTYLLANKQDWDRFVNLRESANKNHLWIMKPVNSACGRGVKMINKNSKVSKKRNYLICEYVVNPHLINGLKYDLRLYVLVSSYDPLRIYLYEEGLVRFATEKYSTNTNELSKRYVHLTNWSVNKYSKQFVINKDENKDGTGSKWSLSALKKKYQELGIDVDSLFEKIKDLLIKTCISAEPHMLDMHAKGSGHKNNCFELYGFDVLIDANFKPWVLEVNVCPSLSSSSPLDRKIKHTLLSDIFNLVGVLPYDKKKLDDDKKKKQIGGGIQIKKEEKCIFSKNLKDMVDLNQENCIQKLQGDDWQVLFETDEEYHRRGQFERIFPIKNQEKSDYYLNFFEYPRYHNLMVSKWLSCPVNFLVKILKKKANCISV